MAWVDNDPPRSQRLLSKNPTARCKITFYKKFSVRETDSPSFRFIYIYNKTTDGDFTIWVAEQWRASSFAG